MTVSKIYDKIRYTQKGKRSNKVMSRTRQNRRSKRKECVINGCICLLIAIVLYGSMGAIDYIETHYNRLATVTECKDDNIITKDKQGNLFAFEGDGFKVGNEVVLEMYTNHTDNTIKDDEILNAKLK